MTAYTDFHYSPTGSGVISGSQVLEQTEQGINGLGQYVQDNISGAIDTANQALTIAQTANTNATTALNTANSFSDAITTANQTANNALTTAQSAQSTANAASSLATTANNNANTALNAANTATSNVNTLTSTVNGLGNRMTTAENAISTNAGNITTLQTNLQTTNNNVTAAANAASSAQATATSAQSTATLARNQAYVLRYTGTTITGGGTIAYADIDNTDNIKAGDKIIDISGAIYAIASVDTANQTVTVGATEIINLAVLPDLFNSANTWTGDNTFTAVIRYKTSYTLGNPPQSSDAQQSAIMVTDSAGTNYLAQIATFQSADATGCRIAIRDKFDSNGFSPSGSNRNKYFYLIQNISNQGYLKWDGYIDNSISPLANNTYNLGNSTLKWKTLNGINPGALSLPNLDSTQYDPIDFSQWNVNLSLGNNYTPQSDGWIHVNIKDSTDCSVFVFASNSNPRYAASAYGNGSQGLTGRVALMMPVRAGVTYTFMVKASSTSDIYSVIFIPALGNV